MKYSTGIILALLAISMLWAGCGRETAGFQPPQIQYGADTCDACHMIINEPRYAAAWQTPKGDVKRFDDIGEMIKYFHEQQRPAVAVFWFHDYDATDEEKWLTEKDAFFVVSKDLHTPMGHGIVAVSSRSIAEKLAQKTGGKIKDFKQLTNES